MLDQRPDRQAQIVKQCVHLDAMTTLLLDTRRGGSRPRCRGWPALRLRNYRAGRRVFRILLANLRKRKDRTPGCRILRPGIGSRRPGFETASRTPRACASGAVAARTPVDARIAASGTITGTCGRATLAIGDEPARGSRELTASVPARTGACRRRAVTVATRTYPETA